MTVKAISTARSNAELIAQCAELGYLRKDIITLDPTYGKGRFWTKWCPDKLIGTDLDPDRSLWHLGGVNFTKLEATFEYTRFEQIVFDPPYKLNGTSTGKGPSASDVDYAVTEYKSWRAKHDLIQAGISSCAAVAADDCTLLIKCQDQVCCGEVRWQTHEFARHAAVVGFRLVDMLHLRGGRKQPEGRTKTCPGCKGSGIMSVPLDLSCGRCEGSGRLPSEQQHAARNYSTLLITRRGR